MRISLCSVSSTCEHGCPPVDEGLGLVFLLGCKAQAKKLAYKWARFECELGQVKTPGQLLQPLPGAGLCPREARPGAAAPGHCILISPSTAQARGRGLASDSPSWPHRLP